MLEWLRTNWLALSSGLIAVLALVISFFTYRHTVRRDAIRLRFRCEPHPNIRDVAGLLVPPDPDGDGPYSVQAYRVSVINDGGIAAHLADAGLVTQGGRDLPVSVQLRPMIYGSLAAAGETLPPKSGRTYDIWYGRGGEPFEVAACYAVDSTGKRWQSKVKDRRTRRALLEALRAGQPAAIG